MGITLWNCSPYIGNAEGGVSDWILLVEKQVVDRPLQEYGVVVQFADGGVAVDAE